MSIAGASLDKDKGGSSTAETAFFFALIAIVTLIAIPLALVQLIFLPRGKSLTTRKFGLVRNF